ncbi:hypothetical protein [Flavobacterium sp.]|uniref:hypothetical protein n=1 Tax=Flavobacterium sp. TaxID=239 RepID=UPI0025C256EC|nr:hypothetical protein [Flavobacterium sp.]
MNRILTNICFLLFISVGYGQKIEKTRIYIGYNYNPICPKVEKVFSEEHNGIIFNLNCIKETTGVKVEECGNRGRNDNYISLLCVDKADTIDVKKIEEYKVLNIVELKKKEIAGSKKLLDFYKRKKDIYHRPITKDNIFKTYVIEIINDKQFVVYPVKWKNPFGYDDYGERTIKN